MSVERAEPATAWTVLTVLALVATIFFYLLAQSSISGLGASDAAGNGLASGFAYVGETLLWFSLGLFFLLCALRGRPPAVMLIVGIVVIGVGAIASLIAIGLMERPGWLQLTPMLAPPLTALFAGWMAFSREAPSRLRVRIALGFALVAAPLLITPFYAFQAWLAAAPEREAETIRLEAEYERSVAEARAADAAAFEALGPDSRLEDFFPYIADPERAERALTLLRTARSREADAVRLLDADLDHHELQRMPEFDMEITPDLCRAYRGFIDRKLAGFRPDNANWEWVPRHMEWHLPSFRWFGAGGCDLSPQVRRIAEQLRAISPAARRPNLEREFDALARAPAGSPP
jgi:hypothetical protein